MLRTLAARPALLLRLAAAASTAPEAGAAAVPPERLYPSSGRRFRGTVISAAMMKTVVVAVTRVIPHPMYNKEVTRHRKFYAHDELDVCREGDRVEIRECRPISKTKRYVVDRVLETAPEDHLPPALLHFRKKQHMYAVRAEHKERKAQMLKGKRRQRRR